MHRIEFVRRGEDDMQVGTVQGIGDRALKNRYATPIEVTSIQSIEPASSGTFMAIGIDPTVDFACKMLLGSPDHPAITLHFLNAVLGGTPRITEVQILNPIVGKEYEADKVSILDVLATDDQGRLFDIEVQTTLPAGLPERLTYYAATQLIEQLGEGDSYLRLRPSIGICILDAILFREVPDLHLDFRLRTRGGLDLTDCLQIHLLELPKYAPPGDNRQARITDPLEEWAYFFRRAGESTAEELNERLVDPVFSEAAGVLEMIAKSPEERRYYEARLKMQRDEQARLEAAEARGAAIGRVRLLQQLAGVPESSVESLRQQTLEELAEIESDLQRRLRERS